MIRNDWKMEEIKEIYDTPLMRLIAKSHAVHTEYHDNEEVQVCSLISFKTGGCPENCKYCPQSSHYKTEVAPLPLLQYEEMVSMAQRAVSFGATRVCIGAAWREVKPGKAFDVILKAVKEITSMGVEVCCTLGMLEPQHAKALKEAGLYAYNHNLDTSQQYYKTIITTRTYEERLATLDTVEEAELSVCCGGILGMGESDLDRVLLIHTLATRKHHPESVPINFLIPIPGTPLENNAKISIWEMLRMIATARITMPKAMIRLSAGRADRSFEEQALCFFAGANAIFSGEKLLTQANHTLSEDDEMFQILGLKKRPSFKLPLHKKKHADNATCLKS